MKGLFVLLGLIALTHSASAQQLALPEKCEDVFSQKQCDALRSIAKKFGETATDLNNAIKEAAKKHLQNAKDILAFVQEYLVTNAKNLKCEDYLSPETCDQLDKIGKLLRLKTEQINTAIREAIAHGATTAKDIYQKAKDYARDVLSKTKCEDYLTEENCARIKDFATMAHLRAGEVIKAVREAVIEGAANVKDIAQKAIDFLTGEITCENILGASTCEKLEKAANLLGEKMSDINAAVRAAVTKHYTKISEILNFVQQYLVEKATNFKCENVLNQNLCAKIMTIGGHFKDGIATINKAIKEAVVHGATGIQEIYNVAVAWLRDNVKAKKCEDLISAAVCQKIKDFATKVHVNVKDVLTAVKEAIAEGAWNPADLYKKAVEYLKSKISCEAVLGKATCDKIRNLADKFSVSLAKVDEVMRNAIASGVTKVKDLYKTVVKYILDKWTDLFGDEEMLEYNEKRSITDTIKEAIMKAVNSILDKLNVVSQNIRQKIREVILKGKLRISEIKAKIMELLGKVGTKSEDEIQFSKRSLKDDLKEALGKADGMTKELIKELLKQSKESLDKGADWIKKILEKYGIGRGNAAYSFIDVMLDSTADEILRDLEEETTVFTDMIVADMFQEADLL